MRSNGRGFLQLRDVQIIPHVLPYAEGSAEIHIGKTRVLCSASVEESVPRWMQNSGKGWVTAEYGMLPRSTDRRIKREKAHSSGRTQEISRLIGRSLRSCTDLKALGERQIHIDCDVIQADGGTRTASITGGFVALALAVKNMLDQPRIKTLPLFYYVSAVSVAVLDGRIVLDPCASEDRLCSTDMNLVFSHFGDFVEIQGTAEQKAFNQKQLLEMLDSAKTASQVLFQHQEKALDGFFPQSKTSKS